MDNQTKILFIAEKSQWCYKALELLKQHFSLIESIFWNYDDPKLKPIQWNGDWIISFKSDLLLPTSIINSASKGALNFHPAPPRYRGIGGYNHSIYNNDTTFGTTCHHMSIKIDNGKIIKVNNFPIAKHQTATSLREEASKHSFELFKEILEYIIFKKQLPASKERWGNKLYTHKSLDKFIADLKSKNIKHNCLL